MGGMIIVGSPEAGTAFHPSLQKTMILLRASACKTCIHIEGAAKSSSQKTVTAHWALGMRLFISPSIPSSTATLADISQTLLLPQWHCSSGMPSPFIHCDQSVFTWPKYRAARKLPSRPIWIMMSTWRRWASPLSLPFRLDRRPNRMAAILLTGKVRLPSDMAYPVHTFLTARSRIQALRR